MAETPTMRFLMQESHSCWEAGPTPQSFVRKTPFNMLLLWLDAAWKAPD